MKACASYCIKSGSIFDRRTLVLILGCVKVPQNLWNTIRNLKGQTLPPETWLSKESVRPWGIIIQPEKEQPIPMLGQIIDPLLSNDRAFRGSCLYFFFSFTDSLSSKSFQFRHKMKQNMLAYQLQTHMYKKLCVFLLYKG